MEIVIIGTVVLVGLLAVIYLISAGSKSRKQWQSPSMTHTSQGVTEKMEGTGSKQSGRPGYDSSKTPAQNTSREFVASESQNSSLDVNTVKKSADEALVLHLSLDLTVEEEALLKTFVQMAEVAAAESITLFNKLPAMTNDSSGQIKDAVDEAIKDIGDFKESIEQICQDTLDGKLSVLGGFPTIRDACIEYLTQLITYQSRARYGVLKYDASLTPDQLRVGATQIYLDGTLDCIELLRKANMVSDELTGDIVREAVIATLVEIMLSSETLSDEDRDFLNSLLSSHSSSEEYASRYAREFWQGVSIDDLFELVTSLAAKELHSAAEDISMFILRTLNRAILASDNVDERREDVLRAYGDKFMSIDDGGAEAG